MAMTGIQLSEKGSLASGATTAPNAPWARRGLLALGAADLLVPAPEGGDHRLRIEGQFDRVVGDQPVVLGPPELLYGGLALRGRHVEGHALHGRARVEVALVVGVGLLLLGEQVVHQVKD